MLFALKLVCQTNSESALGKYLIPHMLSQAVFMVTGELEDDVLLIPDLQREIYSGT